MKTKKGQSTKKEKIEDFNFIKESIDSVDNCKFVGAEIIFDEELQKVFYQFNILAWDINNNYKKKKEILELISKKDISLSFKIYFI